MNIRRRLRKVEKKLPKGYEVYNAGYVDNIGGMLTSARQRLDYLTPGPDEAIALTPDGMVYRLPTFRVRLHGRREIEATTFGDTQKTLLTGYDDVTFTGTTKDSLADDRLTVGAVRAALAMALAVDGYIDLSRQDGEAYIHGDAAAYQIDKIEGDATSLHRFLTMDPEMLQAARAEIEGRAEKEGRA